jgi:MarR family transcriptional regulator, organic hydroperoxide resistance regulator
VLRDIFGQSRLRQGLLWEEDDQTVSGLGEMMFLESTTLTPILKKLEAMEYLTRRRDPGDKRQVRVSLTKAGRCLREKGLNMTLAKQTGLPTEEFSKLQKVVSKLRDNLIEATGSD